MMSDRHELLLRGESISRRGFMQASAAALGGLAMAGPGWPETTPEVTVGLRSAPPARQLFAWMEELTSFSWDMRLTLTCLQGIVNRSKPRLTWCTTTTRAVVGLAARTRRCG